MRWPLVSRLSYSSNNIQISILEVDNALGFLGGYLLYQVPLVCYQMS